MLQRLYQSLLRGPSLNARPHNSRQRLDATDLESLGSMSATEVLASLLSAGGKAEIAGTVASFNVPDYPESEWSDEQKVERQRWDRQQRVLRKLADIAGDAQEYYNDHGEQALFLGFPILSLPPGKGSDAGMRSSRVLAPLFLMPLEVAVRRAARRGATLKVTGEGADRLIPNPALMTLLEQQTGQDADEMFADEGGDDPEREIQEVLTYVARATGAKDFEWNAETEIAELPKAADLPSDATILPSAVLGLFPMSNPGLLRDTKWMIAGEEELVGPVNSFLRLRSLDSSEIGELPEAEDLSVEEQSAMARQFDEEYFVAQADPCQSAAVDMAQTAPVLVMHGPPGTGKSQTIVNIIGNHLARGERLLFVCDKRTALDVVKYRLEAIGLGSLCGVIHDPQRDRRDFYMGLRSVIEGLPDSGPDKAAKRQLEQVNQRLASLHGELREAFILLHGDDEVGQSYHDLVGQWLEAKATATVLLETAEGVDSKWALQMADVESHRADVVEVLSRARDARYAENPWPKRVGLSLDQWLQLSPDDLDEKLSAVERAGASVDAKPFDARWPLPVTGNLEACVTSLRESAQLLRQIEDAFVPVVADVLGKSEAEMEKFRADWQTVLEDRDRLQQESLERELAMQVRGAWPSIGSINASLHALGEWKTTVSKWTRLFAIGKKKAARAALVPLGIHSLEIGDVDRAVNFYQGVKSRLLVADTLSTLTGATAAEDEQLAVAVEHVDSGVRLWDLLDGVLQYLADSVRGTVNGDRAAVAAALDAAAERGDAIIAWEQAATESEMWKRTAIEELSEQFRRGRIAVEILDPYRTFLPLLEPVLRLEHNVRQFPESMCPAAEWLAGAADRCEDEEAIAALQAASIHHHLEGVLSEHPALAHIDSARIEAAFDELNQRLAEKQELTRRVIVDYWTELQRHRLLASTGSRVNSTGAGLRQRLLVRGKRALTLRQMVASGAGIEGGDPLFDLCPVWMASADTVAQIFPRETVFDCVVFDEASQCRLEEALPVLLRAKRVVIAGDPRQLPPTRFFESALVDSEDTDAETPEELHQQQISETEDLLTAALNLDVHEAFLDVHYRSQNEALIGFSNQHFYQGRLQPIPGHPKNKALTAPIRLLRVDGIYREQTNRDEASAIVELVAELLAEAEPPSIGIASFNLKQRTLILELLEQRAEAEASFADKLERARQRRGRDSFEGLFVKNLENVQGDERDHILISTTFGRDTEGKFRRNFGALSRLGGERRLNVLVTRARRAIHVFTSIPRSEYSGATLPGPGERVSGRHLLYAYLRYAEQLETTFESYHDHLESLRGGATAGCEVEPSESPSNVATALGHALAHRHKAANTVHWGNDGFCIDVAMVHPHLPEDVTIGVLTDFNRFRKTPDPVDWERFRSLIFRAQGWKLHRLWSPRLLRDAEGELQEVLKLHEQLAIAEE